MFTKSRDGGHAEPKAFGMPLSLRFACNTKIMVPCDGTLITVDWLMIYEFVQQS